MEENLAREEQTYTESQLLGMAENLLFAAGDPVEVETLALLLGADAQTLRSLLLEETARREQGSGLVYKWYEDKIQLTTRPEAKEGVEALLGSATQEELTRAMLETLAIVAYKQPVTRSEIDELRGVNSSYMIGALLERKLICEAGRKETLGRPILYATGTEFLRHFDLRDLESLPPLPQEEETFEAGY